MSKPKELVQFIAEAADDKLASDIVVLDMEQISIISDYFLICDGSNERQVQSIAKGIRDSLLERGVRVKSMEGNEQGRWIIIDAGDIVCHVFHEEERSFYNLERLWGDATVVSVKVGQEG